MTRNKRLLVFWVLLAGVAAASVVFLHAGWKQVKLVYATGLAVDRSGNVYIVDANNYTVDKLTPEGKLSVLAGSPGKYGVAAGQGEQARFGGPASIAVGPDGSLFVSDSGNQMIYKITPGGMVSILAGGRWQLSFDELKQKLNSSEPMLKGFSDGMGIAARFNMPRGLAVDGAGNVYVADAGNNLIRKIAPDGMVSTLAGGPGKMGHDDGMGEAARFSSPGGVSVDAAGNVYVADGVMRKITPDGMVSTLFGTAGKYGYADGLGAREKLGPVLSIAANAAGELYFINGDGNNAGWLSKITPDGELSRPGANYARGSRYGRAVAIDQSGVMYLLTSRGVEKILPSGQSMDLVKQPQYDQGPVARLIDYLPDGWAALAIIAAAFANIVLLVIALALAANRLVQIGWKAALKTSPPSISTSLAALGVAALMVAFVYYAYWPLSDYYGMGGIMMPSSTELVFRFGRLLMFVPVLLLVLFFVLIKSARRERYFTGILAGVTVLAFMVMGSMFWPIFLHYAGEG